MKKKMRGSALVHAALAVLFSCMVSAAALGQQVLYPDLLGSNPADAQTNVFREQGRKGLLFHLKFQDGANLDSNTGFPLNMATAVVTLQIGVAAPLTCSPGSNPAPNAASYVVVDGPDADGAMDTVKVFYNGDFPPNTAIKYSVSGAKSTPFPAITQNGDPSTVTFTTGNTTPRDPASIELVFDISGSMALPAVPGGNVSRMDALKSASQVLFGMLDDYAWLGDKVGVVYFSSTSTVFDPTPGGSNLELAQDTTKVQLIAQNIQAQVPTNSTSIGAGLQAANVSGFAADPGSTRKKSVILFSDGEQNAAPLVAVSGTNVQVNGTNYVADNICPVTAGVMSAPGFKLQQDIANAKGGGRNAYILPNKQTFAQADLETFFMGLLSDFLVGDKVEAAKDLTGKIANSQTVTQKFLANPNDVALSVLLTWPAANFDQREGGGFVTFRLIAPDGTEVDQLNRTKTWQGGRFTTVHFPAIQNGKSIPVKGEWTVELTGQRIRAASLDYHLAVLLDNSAIASDYHIDAQDVGTGEDIPLRVQLTEGGSPIHNATVTAEVLGPDNGVGNILSKEATPGGVPNSAGDIVRSAAQGKLLLLLNDPTKAGLFSSNGLPTITLADDGKSAKGDATAGDGIYSAVFKDDKKEGHYQFRISVRGSTAAQGDFQRTRTLTVFVRPKPVAANTEFKLLSSTTQPDGSVLIRLHATPRDGFNNFLGPDYLDSLAIKSSMGTMQGSLEDKLDGSYEISYRLPSTASDPNLSVEVFGQTVIKTTLKNFGAGKGPSPASFPSWAIPLLLLLLILIILWLLFSRKKGAPSP